MPGIIEKELGKLIISDEIFANLAGLLAIENYGIVGMASQKASEGFWELLGRENAGKGVKISTENNVLTIDLYVMVEYGVSINAVAENVIDNVSYQIREMTSMPVDSINVHVEGVRVQKDQ